MSIPTFAATDVNDRPSLTAVSSVDDVTIVRLVADPATGALLVSAASNGTQILNEVVSGSGTSWTLANTPTSAGIALYASGQRLAPTTDYTLSGKTITTVLSWSTGLLLADYTY